MKSLGSVSQASVSSGSISDKNTEHGFNCDSPEGGTIRKKPNHHQISSSVLKSSCTSTNKPLNSNGNYLKSNLSQDKTQNRSSDSNNAVDSSSTPSSQKPVKGVRFKESFLTIPRPPSEAFGDETYDNNTSA